MSELVARTGRHQQRYNKEGYRLVAGCIPYRHVRDDDECNGNLEQTLEVLMITSQSGHGFLFPKGGWETDESEKAAAQREAFEEAGVEGEIKESLGSWKFKSKSQRDEGSPEGLCMAEMFGLNVTKELDSWPEQNQRQRQWLSIGDAREKCRDEWMKEALEKWVKQMVALEKCASSDRTLTSSESVTSLNNNCSSQLTDQE